MVPSFMILLQNTMIKTNTIHNNIESRKKVKWVLYLCINFYRSKWAFTLTREFNSWSPNAEM